MSIRESLLVIVVLLACGGCGTLPNGRSWGEDATFAPGWDRVRTSALNAARDPWVWAPLAGAAVLQIDDWDERAARWATTHTPIFGSQRSADDWSDRLRAASILANVVTLAATPSGDEPGEWFANKTKGALIQLAAAGTTALATSALKDTVDRERPNGRDRDSFPSGHASISAVQTRSASRNLASIEMSDGMRTSFDIGLYALTIGTSWARIEAGQHYPSDTLFGMALGNFLAAWFNDAFLGLDANKTQIAFAPMDGGGAMLLSVRF
jgi:membrane-associated phospholipid phosphatase